MEQSKRIAFLVNGRLKGLKQKIRNIENTFGNKWDAKCFITEKKYHNIELAGEVILQGYNHIINIGGDGSLNETLNGILKTVENSGNPQNLHDLKLGVLPAGSGNDFARMLSIKNDLTQLYHWIENDFYAKFDIGLAEFLDIEGKETKRYFINITDVGMGGIVAKKIANPKFRWLPPALLYQKAIIETLFTYKKQHISAESEEFDWEGKIMNFVVANGKYFGSGLGIAPDASPFNGLFNVVILGDISFKDYLLNLQKVKNCKKINHPSLHYYQTRSVELNTTENPMPIDMDGEFVGYTPVKLSILHEKISFIFEKKLAL